ncbi:hypothetical protein GCM10010274_08600 [Streptomyces lavendofoliae]|uniref:Uncharacterized protein n=1 Tax=Streptomyces lavendofoliae TaxID=67314 RepID=A0A918HT92_9ACTN|nr:hypothetical protein GCM10010274_08600 [Streptomyces lavendofoliae]
MFDGVSLTPQTLSRMTRGPVSGACGKADGIAARRGTAPAARRPSSPGAWRGIGGSRSPGGGTPCGARREEKITQAMDHSIPLSG